MLKITQALTLFALTASCATWGQTVNVTMLHTGEGSEGGRLAYLVRAELRNNRAVRYIDKPDSTHLAVNLVTLQDSTLPITHYSAAWSYGPPLQDVYLTSTVGVCGANKIRECAESVAAKTDEIVSNFLASTRKK